jgi:hypothetical protein
MPDARLLGLPFTAADVAGAAAAVVALAVGAESPGCTVTASTFDEADDTVAVVFDNADDDDDATVGAAGAEELEAVAEEGAEKALLLNGGGGLGACAGAAAGGLEGFAGEVSMMSAGQMDMRMDISIDISWSSPP